MAGIGRWTRCRPPVLADLALSEQLGQDRFGEFLSRRGDEALWGFDRLSLTRQE
jgi:hypothetical protein